MFFYRSHTHNSFKLIFSVHVGCCCCFCFPEIVCERLLCRDGEWSKCCDAAYDTRWCTFDSTESAQLEFYFFFIFIQNRNQKKCDRCFWAMMGYGCTESDDHHLTTNSIPSISTLYTYTCRAVYACVTEIMFLGFGRQQTEHLKSFICLLSFSQSSWSESAHMRFVFLLVSHSMLIAHVHLQSHLNIRLSVDGTINIDNRFPLDPARYPLVTGHWVHRLYSYCWRTNSIFVPI